MRVHRESTEKALRKSHKDTCTHNINKEIEHVLRRKNRLCRKYVSGGMKRDDEINLREAPDIVSDLISTSKEFYFTNMGKRLSDPRTSSKTYWSILKRFLNKIKIHAIPPLLVHDEFIIDFQRKASILNENFANQCSVLENGSSYHSGNQLATKLPTAKGIFYFTVGTVKYNKRSES